MPELPEVETTRCGIATTVTGQVVRELIVRSPRLRWPIPSNLPTIVGGMRLISCGRRGKYLLLHFGHGTQIVHLGMSGSLRQVACNEPPRRHDHVDWIFDHVVYRLHDPRRFGAVLWHSAQTGPLSNHPLLAKLGIEPFDDSFDGSWLHTHCKDRNVAIKKLLLAGHTVVGIGNIYASESLFRAHINPTTIASQLSRTCCNRLSKAIRATLVDALAAGGSTLRDYVSTTGKSGTYLELHAAVYERTGQPCHICGMAVSRIMQDQRATYYCPVCQQN